MNAERDVQRLVTDWLAEEAEVRAPDRVLESARQTIDRTMQRRWLAAWREPVTLTTTKLAALAAALVLALAGAAWLGRSTAPGVGGPGSSGTPAPTASAASGVTIGTYRIARDQICLAYAAELNPLNEGFDALYDEGLSRAERDRKLADLRTIRDRTNAMINELAALSAPPDVADDAAAQLADYRSIVTLITELIGRVQAGDLVGAKSMDVATDPFSSRIGAFESKYLLVNCP